LKKINVRKRKRTINGKESIDYVVDLGICNGKRRTFARKTRKEVSTVSKKALQEYDRLGAMAGTLTQAQLLDAYHAHTLLVPLRPLYHVSLTDAAVYYIKCHECKPSPSVDTVLTKMLGEMAKGNRRARSIQSAHTSLSRFADICGDGEIPINQIGRDRIDHYLETRSTNSFTTQANDITYLKQLFNFAEKQGYITDNPTKTLTKPTIDRKMPEYMKAEDVKRFMAEIQKTPEFVYHAALLFFAGIRPAEVMGLQGRDINIGEGIITITSDIAKCRKARIVEISDNLEKWLHYAPFESIALKLVIRLARQHFNKRRVEICKKLNIKWSPDIARHTFATFHLAVHKNAALTAHELGHTHGVDLLYTHYRGLATETEAEMFWGICPDATIN